MRRGLLAAGLLLALTSLASADLIGVNWVNDNNPDGLNSGTLGSLGVTLTSTDGSVNGGDTFSADWPGRAGTKDVPGIAGLAGANRSAIDWNAGTTGFATISFTGGSVTNPILLFDFTDPNETFGFASGVPLSILDQSPAGSVWIASGNVVTLNGTPSNGPDDSFALQLTGTYSSITFQTNLAHLSAQSVGFSIAVSAVPEPSSVVLTSIGLLGLSKFVRRRRIAA